MALILVTGASEGLGWETANALAEQGHEVVLHARRADRLAADRLAGHRPPGDHLAGPRQAHPVREVLFADLSSAEETVRLAAEANAVGRFDAVIHNAGVWEGPEVFPVNLLAPFMLTVLMTQPARSIIVSSGLHRSGSTGLERVARGGQGVTYSDSKLYVTALALAMARRLPGTMAHAVDPGWVPTRMGGPSAPGSLLEGHRTQDWLATARPEDIVPRTGGYWHHRTPRDPHPAALDQAFQEELIRHLEALTGLAFPG